MRVRNIFSSDRPAARGFSRNARASEDDDRRREIEPIDRFGIRPRRAHGAARDAKERVTDDGNARIGFL